MSKYKDVKKKNKERKHLLINNLDNHAIVEKLTF